jgi:hypothetical protein
MVQSDGQFGRLSSTILIHLPIHRAGQCCSFIYVIVAFIHLISMIASTKLIAGTISSWERMRTSFVCLIASERLLACVSILVPSPFRPFWEHNLLSPVERRSRFSPQRNLDQGFHSLCRGTP